MILFIETLKKDVDQSLLEINTKEIDILGKAKEVILLLETVFSRLRVFIREHQFKNDAEEILFFKEIKPKLFALLIYYHKVYNLEMGRPIGGEVVQKEHLERELQRIKIYFEKNRSFYTYYRSGDTHMDGMLFQRGQPDIYLNLESFYFERDPLFSTVCDFKMAKVMANELFEKYILEKLNELKDENQLGAGFRFNLKWTASKTDLTELIYGLYIARVFNHGKATLKQIADCMNQAFHIELDSNLSRTFYDLRIRSNRTSFLDRLKTKLTKMMDDSDEK